MRTLSLAAAALAAAVAVGVSTAAPPRWQAVPGAAVDNEAVLWAAGRLWFVQAPQRGGYAVRSARFAGGRFGAWRTVRPALGSGNWTYQAKLRDDLVFATSAAKDARVVVVRMRADGTLGDPTDLAGAPLARSSTGSPVVQLPDRPVRLVGIGRDRLGACCDTKGQAVDFASFIPPGSAPKALLGTDRRGRVWLAWTHGRRIVRQQARVVELDPTTLRPRGQPTLVAGFRGLVNIRALLCSDTCRVVADGYGRGGLRAATWAPGERSPTRLRLPGRGGSNLIGAAEDGGRLLVAYSTDRTELAFTVAVAVGSSRGAGLRRVASIRQPTRLGTFERGVILNSIPFGAFGPPGFAAVGVYTGQSRPQVRVAVLGA